MKLIVNADDFGMSRGVNYGIFDAHIHGIVTSTTMMITMLEVDHAIELSKKAPKLGIGLHLNMTLGKPLTKCPSLINGEGFFHKPLQCPDQNKFNEEEIYQEFSAQYDLFVEKTKRAPTHFDSHLYAHQKYEKARSALIRLASEKNIPVRDIRINQCENVLFYGWFKKMNGIEINDLVDLHFQDLVKQEICELMVHPAYVDDFLMECSSYNIPRTEELEVLTSNKIKSLIKEYNINLINYNDVRR